MSASNRLNALLSEQMGGPHSQEETSLLGEDVVTSQLLRGRSRSDTYAVTLSSGLRAYFKPAAGLNKAIMAFVGQTLDGATNHEACAWLLAKKLDVILGEKRYAALVAPSVVRTLVLPDLAHGQTGALSAHRDGRTLRLWPWILSYPLTRHAWFFDVLIGQQDRNMGNVVYDRPTRRLSLIDHAVCFARAGDQECITVFSDWRKLGLPLRNGLSEEEKQLCETIVNSNDLFGVAPVLEPGRAEALQDRARRMLQRGRLLASGDY